jgi:hypothetical protein
LASVGNATAFGCTVVSTMTREKSDGLTAPVRVAAFKLVNDHRNGTPVLH